MFTFPQFPYAVDLLCYENLVYVEDAPASPLKRKRAYAPEEGMQRSNERMQGYKKKAEQIRKSQSNFPQRTSTTPSPDGDVMFRIPRSKIIKKETSSCETMLQSQVILPLVNNPTLRIPPTPCRSVRTRNNSPFRNLYTKVTTTGRITVQGKNVELVPYAEGSYMNVHTVHAEHPLVSSLANDQLVLKFYNDQKSNFRASRLESYMSSSITNYSAAITKGLAVAKIYNLDTAKIDCFFLQEKVPHEVDVTHSFQMEQVHQFFLASLKYKVVLDLKPSNLRVKDNGIVTLIDFVEDAENDGGIVAFINQALRLWCTQYKAFGKNKAETKEFLDQLTKGLEEFGHNLHDNEGIIDHLFFEVRSQYIMG